MASATTAPLDALPPTAPRSGLFGFTRAQGIALVVMLAAIVVLPFFVYPQFLMKLLCFALFACAFNLLIGYVGLLSFGHAAYFGMGSYVSAYASQSWGLSPELCVLIGGAVGAGLGLVFGWIAIRRAGIYFAMITLALAQMVYFFCVQVPFTRGEDGIQGIPRHALLGMIDLGPDMRMYWFVAGVFLIGFLLIHRVIHSPFGQVLTAIRENEPRAVSLGYRVDDYKLLAFVLSAGLAGVAGGTKALTVHIATLIDVNWPMSGEVVLMTLLGGLGTLFGPVVGAGVVMAMETYLAPFGAWVTISQGIIFVACVLAFRAGIVGELAKWLRVKL
ncbi:ABC transporter permease subunit [Muricoccus aerilatus]|uniref:ABC transporter permease subunit n=1 Tax=Muricoccus aerilatus TaxID=452982 RepID=UPI000A06A0F9